ILRSQLWRALIIEPAPRSAWVRRPSRLCVLARARYESGCRWTAFITGSRDMSRFCLSLAFAAAFALAAATPALAAKDLVIGLDSNSPHLDPANTNDTLSQSIERTMYQGLFGFDRDMKLIPALAEKVEADESATEFVFQLRQGVTFHDGTPFNADAV